MTTTVVYQNDSDFGHIESVPLSLEKQTCEELWSKMINLTDIQHLTQDQQDELVNLLNKYAGCFTEVVLRM